MAIYIGLGANLDSPLGPPLTTLESALERFPAHGLHVVCRSRWYRSAAYPDPSDPPFVNGVVEIETDLDPAQLLEVLHRIEADFGRRRRRQWEPRPIDLDLLAYGDLRLEASDGGPQVPHPRLAERAFVLLPLRELAPDWHHPESGASIAALIAALPPAAVAEPLPAA